MQTRILGRTGLQVSVLGFGCGAVGGLMVRGEAAEQERAVARALELGINYFDTAPLYGNGESEKNLGRVLARLRPTLFLGTKVRLTSAEIGNIAQAIPASLEGSLRRLGREQVDLLQLHNSITPDGNGTIGAAEVLEQVVPTLQRLREQGKIRFFGITANGATPALHQVVSSEAIDTAQVVYNLLNPSAGAAVKSGFPAQDYDNLLARAQQARVGTINIRVLAGGALSGVEERHPLGSPRIDPIGTGADYRADVRRAQRLMPLVSEGYAADLVEAAIRFPLANPAISTILVGYSSLAQLEHAAAAIGKGPLPPAAMARLAQIEEGFVGEPR
jgi:aryl-alcohol dehydrogenase-like predicted oxidoreductase